MKTIAGDRDPTSVRGQPVFEQAPLADRAPVHTGLISTRRAPVRAALARLIFRAGVRSLPVRVVLPDGRRWGDGGPDTPVMYLARPTEFFRRIGTDANIGLGEAYQAGDWHSSNVADLLTVFANRLATTVPPWAQTLRLRTQRLRRHPQANTIPAARRNAAAHYDLSNEMFAAFLDETMTYSAAMFTPSDTDLTRAQLRKIDTVLDDAAVRAGSEVIEIGTGWGALAIRAAKRGASVTTLTLSAEQARHARRRAVEAGVADRVRILVQDYRQAQGRYDAVISVEMIEAVGAEHWPMFFATLGRLVKPGGRVALQAITMPHRRMRVSQQSHTWINKYIFPGGLIPSVEAIEDNLSKHTTLRVAQRRDLGNDYATTLRSWRERFLANWSAVEQAGFDATFRRGWEYYLAYCEAGFRTGYLGLSQFRLAHAEDPRRR
jgi:cyclopropane-fatty-acyl-phospholipid synthase